MYKHIAKVLREARTKRKVTQLQLSKRLGHTSSQFISNIEREQCAMPPDMARKTAKILKVDYDLFAKAASKDTYEKWLEAS